MSLFQKSLNSLYKSVDLLSDFSNVIPKTELERNEFPYFQNLELYVADKFRELYKRLNDLEIEIENQIAIIEDETGDDKAAAVGVYNRLLSKATLIVDRINRELEIFGSPYFGKIKVKRNKSAKAPENTLDVYIGKFAYFDENTNKLLVTDWRAPITNIYYENSGPKKDITFNSPVGQLTGDLLEKRQFDINDARIQKIYDAKSGNVSADEFLLTQLTRRIGKKLKDIVATIQNEQNSIIRNGIDKAMILQGVAGSGKTTIVLHRLAYLFYTYPDKIRPEQSLIVAPNKMFLDYISDVLPSLGIKNVEANTFIFWAKKILLLDENHTISPLETNLTIKELKGTFNYINNVKKFFEEWEEKLLYNLPYSDSDLVISRYYQLKNDNPNISVIERLYLAIEGTFTSIELKGQLVGKYQRDFDVIREKVKKYIKEKTKTSSIYKEFLTDTKYNEIHTAKYSLERFSNKHFSSEDLAPLVYIHLLLHGTDQYMKDYIVVDEAQDMSPFEIFVLSLCAKRENLFLAGDIAQSIIPPFYIKDWNDVSNMLQNNSKFKTVDMFNINRCYRTTVEIIEYTNTILKDFFPKNYKLPEAVLRHGDNVSEISVNTEKDLVEIINKQFDLGAVTVAFITKNDQQAHEFFTNLKSIEDKLLKPVFSYSDSDYRTGILVLPISKAKGLEFDSVFILNPKQYNLDIDLDIRQLYVACTRPLHRLYLLKLNEKLQRFIS